MMRIFGLVYGGVVYLLFLATFLYMSGFVGDVPGLKTIDTAVPGSALTAVLIDVLLLGLFAVQHSVMARRGFKRWWTRFVPRPLERSTYVLTATAVVVLLVWQWRGLPAPVWTVTSGAGWWLLVAISAAGWATVLVSTFLINHFELFGLKQVYAAWRGLPYTPPAFQTPALYRLVRHPIYLGFLLAFWATPRMTVGHLLFAAATTGYILVGIFLEERDLVVYHGEPYRQYQQRVPMLLPLLRSRGRARVSGSVGAAGA